MARSLPPDYFVTAQAFTPTMRQDIYPAIDATQAKFSQAGKVVVITGASRGIGARGFATQFALAKPKAIVLVARDAATLAHTEELVRQVNADVQLLSVPVDISDEGSVEALFETVRSRFGHADVLVNNAGVMTTFPSPGIMDVDVGKWWREFEVNVKGTFLVTKYFLRLLAGKAAKIVNLTSQAGLLVMPGGSGYCISKLAGIQLTAFIAAENPNVVTVAFHPGMVETDMVDSKALAHFCHDSAELAGANAVWLCTEEARFMTGRYMNTNWDVGELAARKDEIVREDLLKIVLKGTFGVEQFKQ